MAFGARVICRPLITRLPALRPFVERAVISLGRHGGTVSVAGETAKPARLEFSLAYIESARNAPPTHEPFAQISGTMSLVGAAARPEFIFDDEGFQYLGEDLAQAEGPLRRIDFEFDGGSFRKVPEAAKTHVLLPEPAEPRTRLAEISVALFVDNQVEAAVEQNDLLDLCLGPEPLRLLNRFPETPEASSSTFILRRNADGAEQTRHHHDDLIPGNGTVDLAFDVIADQRYTLTLHTALGHRRVLFNQLIRRDKT